MAEPIDPGDPGDIAIIGMACRFPGDGTSPESLWKMLMEGKDAWSEFPPDRLNINGFYHPSGNRQGSIPFKGAHFIKGNIAAFDAPFFKISATEAKAIDPQQRILLEVSYEAFENAGIPIESLDGSDTSVNIGSFVKDYEQIVLRDSDWSAQYAATGTGAAILANRLSHTYNLTGPSQTVDTGCSGSLVAVHNCCEDLRSGRSSLAVAGGVGMILTPATMMPMTQLQFLSPNGRCFTFSEKADGYGRGEGVGVVVLKRLADAIRDNDTVRAVIRGSRTNQDGRTPGITMPSTEAQVSNIKDLYQHFNLDADKTAYVECHGTGTQAGDPKEVSAIHQAFCLDHSRQNPIIIGSIKPNIGHLEGAAGVAGLIKATLVVERGQIPKNLHFEAPGNPLIKFNEWNVQVPTELMPWPTNGLRRASVNCFGFGGSNAHVVIDDAAHYFNERSLRGRHQCALSPEDDMLQGEVPSKNFPTTQLFMISSHEETGVGRILDSYSAYINDRQNDPELLTNFAYSLSRRSSLEFKSFVVAQSSSELLEKVQKHDSLEIIHSVAHSGVTPKIAMVFCGQGAQWFAMGRQLMAYETFFNSFAGASQFLKKILESEFNLYDELMKDEYSSFIHNPAIGQPATTAIQVALVDLLKSAGVTPVATVGHSSGEIAAAYAAGYLSREDAWSIAFKRGQCASSLAFQQPNIKGEMLAVGLSSEGVRPYVDKVQGGTVVIACYNSPVSVTLSGDATQIHQIRAKLAADNVFCRLLSVKTAYHSHHMRHVEADYRQSISDISPKQNDGGPQMFSSVTGKLVTGKDLTANYWAQNLVSPVLFNVAFGAMQMEHRSDIILEISPSSVLRRLVKENMAVIKSNKTPPPCFTMLHMNKDAAVTMLEAIGELWMRGCRLNLAWLFKSLEDTPARLLIDLPPYPWNHTKQYWHESHLGSAMRFRQHGREDLIGAPTAESTPQEPRWRGFFRLSENPWMSDHQVQKTVVYPAAGMVIMALEAARQSVDPGLEVQGFEVFNFVIQKPMVIPSTDHGLEHAINAKVVKIATPEKHVFSSVYSFTIYTKTQDGPWQENAMGSYKILYKDQGQDGTSPIGERRELLATYHDQFPHCKDEILPRHLYARLDTIGMNYGPLFQNIVGLSRTENACTSVVRIPDTKAKMPGGFEYNHLIHPATLDSVFQTIFAIGDESMVPSSIKRIYFSADFPQGAGKKIVGYATAERLGLREAQADITMFDDALASPLIIAEGLHFTNLTSCGSAGFLPNHRNLCSEIAWEEYVEEKSPKKDSSSRPRKGDNSVLLVLPDRYGDAYNDDLRDLCDDIQRQLEPIGFIVTKTAISELATQCDNKLCISLVDLDYRFPLFFNLGPCEYEALHMLLRTSASLLWVTATAQIMVDNPKSAPIHALARTIRSEDSSKCIITLDLESQAIYRKSNFAPRIVSVFLKTCCSPTTSEAPEVDFADRAGKLHVPRLKILSGLSEAIEKGPANIKTLLPSGVYEAGAPLNLEIGNVGDLDSVRFERDLYITRALGPKELRVRVIATRLFPVDLDTVLGKTSNDYIGGDVYGIVEEVNHQGDDWNDIRSGDIVLALSYDTIRTRTIINREHVLVCRKESEPELRLFSPSCMVSAYYGLVMVGQVESGDAILIHDAASCLGQTALSIAKRQGALVFAGATTEEQRKFLRGGCNIRDDYIVDTSSTDRFAQVILQLTDGKGVDIVFGSSAETEDGDIDCVTRCGHIIQMWNTSQSQSTVSRKPGASVLKINLRTLSQERPNLLQKLVRDTREAFKSIMENSEEREPQPYHQYFDIGGVSTALRTMQKDRNLGDFVITISRDSVVQEAVEAIKDVKLRSDGTYILVGGLGGLGRIVAELLVTKGARHLAFFSRSGGTDVTRSQFLERLSQQGVNIHSFQVDICDKASLITTLEKVTANMPEVKGVIQAAAVLKDSTFGNMSYDDWHTATRPKILGSWNLHETLPKDMDFMIFLSSAAGVIGNRGQANYAAGNAFQDALAHHRSSEGYRTVSLDLGPILGAGMVAEDEATWDVLKASGFLGIRLEHFQFMVERAIAGIVDCHSQLPAQIVSGVGTGGLMVQNKPSDPYWTRTALFTHLNKVDLPPDMPEDEGSALPIEAFKVALRNANGIEDAGRVICTGLISFLAPSLNLEPSEIDDDKALSVYGVDSLVATNIHSWVFRNVGVKLTDMEVMGSSSIMQLAKTIATKGGFVDDEDAVE